ncbi:MAG: homoserine dehydrogenase, partial [Gammaproteobacteria bacterium]|nr:homoserine dehydrogenase [Gammaproteobacteria bacterium]
MNTVNVGLLGLGTVGGGTALVLSRNADEICRRAGSDIHVSHAAGLGIDPANPPAGTESAKLTADAWDVVNDPAVDIVVELIGGYSPARELVLKAIENGKHVVTANKA